MPAKYLIPTCIFIIPTSLTSCVCFQDVLFPLLLFFTFIRLLYYSTFRCILNDLELIDVQLITCLPS